MPPIPQPPLVIDGVVRNRVRLDALPIPDRLELHLPEGHVALITDDGSATTPNLVQALTEQGWKIVVLNFPTSVVAHPSELPPSVARVTLSELTEEHLVQQLSTIATTYGSIAGFIHLHPAFQLAATQGLSFLEVEKAIVKMVFFLAKHLKPSLTQAAQQGRSCFYSVARLDGAFGFEQQRNYGTIAAGLFGLTKSLGHEWQQVQCRAIDLCPDLDPVRSAQYISAELYDADRTIREVAYSAQGRYTLVC